MTTTDGPGARLSLAAGALALALALGGALFTQFLDPGQTVGLLRILVWVVAGLAALGILLGIAAGMRGAARAGTLLSAVTGLLLAGFLGYSGFGQSPSAPTDSAAPAATGATGG